MQIEAKITSFDKRRDDSKYYVSIVMHCLLYCPGYFRDCITVVEGKG